MSTVSKVINKKEAGALFVSPDTLVFDAIEKMAKISAGTALVMDGSQLVGIISERDFIRKLYLQNKCGQGVSVKEIMSSNLTTVTSGAELDDCMSIMTEKRIRHLPVVDAGAVVGIISMGDIVKYLVDEKEFEIKNLQSYISGPGL
jgi:CBS domain-containing protein